MRRRWRGDVVGRGLEARRTSTLGVGGEESRCRRRGRVIVVDALQIRVAVVDSVDPLPPWPPRPPPPGLLGRHRHSGSTPLRIQAVASASSTAAASDPRRRLGLLDIRAASVFVVKVGGKGRGRRWWSSSPMWGEAEGGGVASGARRGWVGRESAKGLCGCVGAWVAG